MSCTEEGNKLLKEWKTRLGLLDWTIKLEDRLEPDEMELQDSDGCVSWEEAVKCAFVQILDEKFYGKRIRPYDYERILVHELLHLKTCLLSDKVDDLQERVAHQLIDDLARALVDAKRSGARPKGGETHR